ncbi:hypothetical protein [Segatella copri]|nr:hypothetical protein [Segatella copri]
MAIEMQKLTVFTLKNEEKHQKMHFFEEKTKKVAEKFGGTKK